MHKIKELLGERFDQSEESTSLFGKDYSHNIPLHRPEVVIYPINATEVQQILRIANEHKIVVISYGKGTSLEGQILTTGNGSVVMSFEKMDKVISINEQDSTVDVEPGISFPKLNSILKEKGYVFPIDAGPNATIGGMISTCASGTKAVRYGTMKENTISLDVILANGTRIKTSTKARKSSSGYDLTRLFVGSEGTLGVVVKATIKICKIPKAISACTVCFDSIEDACQVVIDLIQQKHDGVDINTISMVELMDDVMMRALNLRFNYKFVEKTTLYFEFGHNSQKILNEQEDAVRKICNIHNGSDLLFTKTEEERDILWKARKAALFATEILRPKEKGLKIWTTDVCVPISRLGECVSETKKELLNQRLFAPIAAHSGDGNFHLFILFDPNNPTEVQEATDINKRMIQRAIRMDGTCTGEHGVGLGKREFVVDELGIDAVRLMKTLKVSLDPNNILNPNKKIPDGINPIDLLSSDLDQSNNPNVVGSKNTMQLPNIDTQSGSFTFHFNWNSKL
eukprot:TRINITY_DN6429_c0_g1_i1.p1 TRINITY_DN6429_c0_g1~~TRINITY_DN6429_c0_g1_i1.p1  ORF type:complete len:513 (+),score=153.22 TRINITY_DN6429_c0_g1_i1:85-1623(+)